MGLWGRYLVWRKRNVVTVEAGEDGFRVRRAGKIISVPWADITVVTAFKRDLMTLDCLCLLVEFDGSAVEIDERGEGFEHWLGALERRLEIAARWRLSVLFPAFEANATEIFRRLATPAGIGQAV